MFGEIDFSDKLLGSDLLVSIVLTTLDAAAFVREAVDSCLNQTHDELELIVVDGDSTDETLAIVSSYDDRRMQIIRQVKNVGKLPGALNLGLQAASGQYLTWMQADSIYHTSAIERMVDALENHPDIGHVYADYWVIDETGKTKEVVQTCEPHEILAAKSDPCGVCFMIRRSVREAIGAHTVETHPVHDYEYRLRIAQHFRSLHLKEPLYYWRLHPASLTGSRPWIVDATLSVECRHRLGLSTARQKRHDMADVHIAYAFHCYQMGKFRRVPGFVIKGLWGNPQLVRNRGVWSIALKSIMRWRGFPQIWMIKSQ